MSCHWLQGWGCHQCNRLHSHVALLQCQAVNVDSLCILRNSSPSKTQRAGDNQWGTAQAVDTKLTPMLSNVRQVEERLTVVGNAEWLKLLGVPAIRIRPMRHVEWSLPGWHASCCRTGGALTRLATWPLTPLPQTLAISQQPALPYSSHWADHSFGLGAGTTLVRSSWTRFSQTWRWRHHARQRLPCSHVSDRNVTYYHKNTAATGPATFLATRATTPGQFTCWTCQVRKISHWPQARWLPWVCAAVSCVSGCRWWRADCSDLPITGSAPQGTMDGQAALYTQAGFDGEAHRVASPGHNHHTR